MNEAPRDGVVPQPESKYLIAFTCTISVEPALTAEEVKSVFDSVRERFPEISNFSKDDDEATQRINNGPYAVARREIYVKSSRGDEIQVVWGPEANEGPSVLETVLERNARFLTPFRVTSFDHNLRYEIPYVGNHFELLSSLYYNQNTVGGLYDALSAIGARVNDNDIKLLMATAQNEVVVVIVRGRTSRSEVASGQYESKEIRVFIGIQMSKPSLLREPLAEAVPRHMTNTQERISKYVIPFILEPLLKRVDSGS